MASNKRILRSAAIAQKGKSAISTSTSADPITIVPSPVTFSDNPRPGMRIKLIKPGFLLPGLSSRDLQTLRSKQIQLMALARTTLETCNTLPPTTSNALNSTLIFAQHSAGTAFFVSRTGWILTCAHCVAESASEYATAPKQHWLLLYTGQAMHAECRFWDIKRDLALLRVIAIETSNHGIPVFSFLSPAPLPVKIPARIVRIGQPGQDDPEAETARKTGYDLVHLSEGRYWGVSDGCDVQDNEDIGAVMHDAWTYWGHSGAPLVGRASGKLVGVHSSWDEGTGMRRGVGVEAVVAFLEECRVLN